MPNRTDPLSVLSPGRRLILRLLGDYSTSLGDNWDHNWEALNEATRFLVESTGIALQKTVIANYTGAWDWPDQDSDYDDDEDEEDEDEEDDEDELPTWTREEIDRLIREVNVSLNDVDAIPPGVVLNTSTDIDF